MTAIEKTLWLIDHRAAVQAEVARAATIDPARISEWRRRVNEGKRVTLTTEQAYGVARYFGVSMDWFCDDAQGVPPVAETASDEMRVILAIVRELGPRVARKRLLNMPGVEVEFVPETEEQRRYAAGHKPKGKPNGSGKGDGGRRLG